MQADSIFLSENVFTGSGDGTRALAICTRGGLICAVVPKNQATAFASASTQIYDFEDAFLCAGLHDSHVHAFHSALYSSPLAEEFLGESEADCVARLAPLAKRKPHGWLLAQGWREYRWKIPKLPSKESLDEAFPNRPVALYSGDAHTLWLNSCALRELNITNESTPPAGGSYDVDEAGDVTGIVRETAAMALMPRIMDTFSKEELVCAYREFFEKLGTLGITSICDMALSAEPGLDFIRDDIYRTLEGRGQLTCRAHLFCALGHDLSSFEEMRENLRGPLVQAKGFKQFFDGVSSQHTAWLAEPYSNARFEGDRGRPSIDPSLMREYVMKAARMGYPVRIHAIGDEAITRAIDIFEEANARFGRPANGHHCIEHLENMKAADIARLARAGIAASVQPGHITLDPGGPERDLGDERCQVMWPFASFLESGATLAFGTDSPVIDVNPWKGIYTAITRQDALTHEPRGGWLAAERISIGDSLRAYTSGAAYAAGREKELGRLAPGMWADIAVFDRNPFVDAIECPECVPSTRCIATFLAGRPVFDGR